MDKRENRGTRWDWLPSQMPGVARLMAEKRAQHGNAHVDECWKRGVLQLEPGWLFAREGALAVGTPWGDDPAMVNVMGWQITSTQALLIMRDPPSAAAETGGSHGAH